MQSYPNIVLVHGAFADGSSWSKVIPLLQDKGFHVIAVQNPLTSLADDVAATRQILARQNGPTILVGHSWGGVVITEAGADTPNVVGLVYIAAFAPDEGESFGELLDRFPPSPNNSNLRLDDTGFLWLDAAGLHDTFAQDVDPAQARVIAAVQRPIAAKCSGDKVSKPAWKSKPSWYLVCENDRTLQPDLERFMAKRIGAKVVSLPASHVPMVSNPVEVANLIMEAAKVGVRG